MPTISLSSSFFTKELQSYSDWRSAFWRAVRAEGEGCMATFNDNDIGMTRNTLEQVYFDVGETTKSAQAQSAALGAPAF
jgi:hypothetical protein